MKLSSVERLAKAAALALIVTAALLSGRRAEAQDRSFDRMVTSNGHAVASFNRATGRIDTFLEHPYRFAAPRNMPADLCYEADESRDLAFDTYFGVRVDGSGQWLPDLPMVEAGPVLGTNIIRAAHRFGSGGPVLITGHMFMPTTIEAPVLVMIAEVLNDDDVSHDVDLYSLFNFRLGDAAGAREPNAIAEQVGWDAVRNVFYEYSDRSRGTIAYVPLSGYTRRSVSSGFDGAYESLRRGANLDDTFTRGETDDIAPAFQHASVTLRPGERTFAAVAIVWAGDEDAGPKVDAVQTWAGTRTPQALLAQERAAWDSWHTAPPAGLSADEAVIWRHSNAMLRMGQVREPGPGFGQILASLPPGLGDVNAQWNIAWVRDMAYAVVGLIRGGHLAEAQAALRFQIEAGPGRRTEEVMGPYRLSATRYFGNGEEETDCNADGPNVEFDGFGLYLWTVREYVAAGGDPELVRSWWPELTTGVADVLLRLTDDEGIIRADSSIWEVHWNGQQKRFTYTSLAAVAGLCGLADVAQELGLADDEARYREAGLGIADALVALHTDVRGTLAQSREDLDRGSNYIDAAAVEAINWGVINPAGRVATSTLSSMLDNLTVATGTGLMRNDDGGWYDSQEWVFIDLRVLPALRATGRTERADELQAWVEGQVLANDLQFSELHTASAGDYAGSIPMIGFGPGAYLIALSSRGAPSAACGRYALEPGEMDNDDLLLPDAGPSDGGAADAGSSDASTGDADVSDDGGLDASGDANFCFGEGCAEEGCGCRVAGAGRSAPLSLVGLLGLLFGVVWRRRAR